MKNRNLIKSFNNAINGIIAAIKAEHNMKIHILIAAAVLVLSLFFDLSKTEFVIVCITIAFVIVCELFNTAVELIIDFMVDVYHPKAKAIKDISAGAVLVSAFLSLVVGYFIFFDRISSELEKGIVKARNTPVQLTLIALIVTVILVLLLKAIIGKGTPFSGGMPSGHAPVAFSITTSVSLLTQNPFISILCIVLALLVIQSRLEAKIHKPVELIAGGALGTLVTLLLFKVFDLYI